MTKVERLSVPLSSQDLAILQQFSGHLDRRAGVVADRAIRNLGLLASIPRELVLERLRAVGRGQGGVEEAMSAAAKLEAAGVTAPQYVLLMGQLLDIALRELQSDWPARPEERSAYERALARSLINETAAGVESCRRVAMERFAAGYHATLTSRAGIERLLGVVREVVGETSASALFTRIVHGARDLARADCAFLWELDRDGRTLRPVAAEGVASHVMVDLHFEIGQGFMGAVAAQEVLLEGDMHGDPRVMRRELVQREGFRAAVGIPLMAKGALVGVLGVVRRTPAPFTEDDKKFLVTLAAYAGSLLEINRLYWEAVGAQKSLQHLHEIAREAVEALAEPTLLQRIVRGAAELTHSERALLWTLDAGSRKLVPVAWHGMASDEAQSLVFGADEGILGQVVRERVPVEADLSTDPRVAAPQVVARHGLRASLRVPILYHGEVRGVLSVTTAKSRRYAPEEIEALTTLASYAASALETSALYRQALEARSTWEATFDSWDDLALLASPEGIVRRANRAICRRLATTPPAVVGKPLSEVLGCGGAAEDPARAALSNCASTSYEGEIPRFPGCTFQIQASPVQTEAGVVLGVIVVLRDVTARKRLEQQLLQAEKLSAIGGLVSGVAHELNNPLSSVLGFAELAAAAEGVPADVRQQLDILRDEAKRAAKIVKNLLAFARQHRPERTMTQLNEIVERVTELLAYELRTSHIKLSLDLSASLPPVLVDANQIQQVLFNLLQNARHACEEKQAQGYIRVSTGKTDQHVLLSVADNGTGIKPEVLPRIFEPFFTTKPPGKGTGLGLSVCCGIVQEHGGQIRVDSTPAVGTTFHVELPIEVGGGGASKKPTTSAFKAPQGLRILVVDDEPAALEFMKRVLGEANTIVASSDGRNAIQALKSERFDLVITDMRMPGLGGRELYRFIVREHTELTNRVIFTTGDVLSTDTSSFLRDFSIPAIEKPFTARDVLRAVIQVLNTR